MAGATDIHVTLAAPLLAELDRVAREQRVTRVQVLRDALVAHLKALEAERVGREMASYAEALAEHSGDFVRETEKEQSRRLRRSTKW